eukprot:9587047-Lingulodinium_polyedra.AAC.1
MMGIVVLAKSPEFAVLMLATLHILSQCSPAFPLGEPLDLSPDLVMVGDDGFVDGDEDDEEEAGAAEGDT